VYSGFILAVLDDTIQDVFLCIYSILKRRPLQNQIIDQDYINRAVLLLLASTMHPMNLQLHYYVLGNDTDFCYPLSVRPDESILELIQKIQEHYFGFTGVKLVFVRLFRINQPQDKMADIATPTTKCLKFATQLQDYWTGDINPDLVHILVIAGRE
jgi:hypothetical protein